MEYERLAYDIALRSLERQERGLEELRARTGTLIAVASIAVSFLGAGIFEDVASAALLLAALLSFVVAVGASGFVLLPDAHVSFTASGPAMYEQMFEHRHDLAEVYRRLTYDLARAWSRNDERVRVIALAYRVATAAFAAETLFLAALASGSLF